MIIRKTNILIVEDEMLTAVCIKTVLLQMGYKVTSIVDSGEEAIQKAEQEHPDIILMDIKIRGSLDGIETAKIIYAKHRIPFIYLTSFSNTPTKQRADATNPFGYVLKPFNEKQLQKTIEKALSI